MGGAIRRKAKIDVNQPQIVEAFREMGFEVEITSAYSAVGFDCIIGLRGRPGSLRMVEIKDGLKPKSQRTLTENEQIAKERWAGNYEVVVSVMDTIALGSILRKEYL